MTPASLAALHKRAFAGESRAWSEAEFETFLSDDQVVCEYTKAGFALARVTGSEAELLTLVSDPDLRRMGHGRALMRKLMDGLVQRGVKVIILEVAQDNLSALNLYESLGFIQIGRRKGYYRKPDGTFSDANVMRCEL